MAAIGRRASPIYGSTQAQSSLHRDRAAMSLGGSRGAIRASTDAPCPIVSGLHSLSLVLWEIVATPCASTDGRRGPQRKPRRSSEPRGCHHRADMPACGVGTVDPRTLLCRHFPPAPRTTRRSRLDESGFPSRLSKPRRDGRVPAHNGSAGMLGAEAVPHRLSGRAGRTVARLRHPRGARPHSAANCDPASP